MTMIDFNTQELATKLTSLEKLTGDAIHNSENEFLLIGSKLQSFLTESKSVTDMSYESAKKLSDGVLTKGIEELETLLQQFREYLQNFAQEIKNDKEELLKILANIKDIYNELDEFKKIVKQLKMLGVSTKIESARLGGDDQGFISLADNVEKLSSTIGDKTIGIKNQSTYLIKEIVEITSNLDRVETVQNEQSQLILENTSGTLEAFQTKNNQCSKIMSEVLNGSKNVSQNISEIVSSIQFHDITRQQIEHVNEVVASMHENCSQIEVIEDNEALTELCMIRDTSELQSAQMQNANDEFYNAVSTIVSNLRNVEATVSEMFLQSTSLIIDNSGLQSQSFKSMEDELLIILAGLIKNISIAAELSNSIKTAVNIVDELALNIRAIEEIGAEIEFIALNARVRSARTGSSGSALGVIAEAIQKLSLVAKNQTARASDILNEINDATERLRINTSEEKRKTSSEELSKFDRQIKNLLNNLQQIENTESAFLEKIKGKVYLLKNEISSTLTDITIHEKVKDISHQAIRLFKEIITQIEILPNVLDNKKENTQALKKKYTMHSERKIHENFTNENTSAVKPLKLSNTENENIFGDNVELF